MSAAHWFNQGVYLGFESADADTQDIPSQSLLDTPWKLTGETHDYRGEGHIITFGPSGSGKTRRLLLPNLNRLTGWSVVVVDPKGSLAIQTAGHRKAHGNRVITLDPFGVIDEQYPGLTGRLPYLKSAGLNPLSVLDPTSDEFPDDAQTLAEALIKVDPRDNQPYFATSAQDLVAGLLMACRLQFKDQASLEVLRALIGMDARTLSRRIKQKNGEGAPGFIDNFGDEYPELANKLNRFSDIAPDNKELTAILNTAQTQTRWLDSRALKADLKGCPHDFNSMKREPTTVYLILPPRYLETHSTWLRLAVTAILMPQLRSIGGKVPVLFMLDEFAQLGRLDIIERSLALVREYGVKFWPILQDLSQLKGLYPDRWESFISNAGVRHLFAAQDVATLEYFSKLSGQRDYWYQTSGQNTGINQGTQSSQTSGANVSWAKSQGPVLWEIGLSKMEQGQAILFNKGDVFRSWLPDPEPRPEPGKPAPANLLPETKTMLDAARATAEGRAAAPRIAGNSAAAGAAAPKVIVVCPHCQTKARVPEGRRIKVTCPGCKQDYMFGKVSNTANSDTSRSGVVGKLWNILTK